MDRRFFLTATAATLLAAPAFAGSKTVDYTPGVIQAALDSGKTVFVDYAADWCGTCKRQERIINALREGNSKYDDAMLFVRVDWDQYKGHEVAVFRDVPRRSTLIVLRGEEELGRLVAETRENEIKALMDKGVKAGA